MLTEAQLVKFLPRLKRYASKFDSRPAQRDDLVQTAVLKIWQCRDQFVYGDDEAAAGWMGVVAHDAFINVFRTEQKHLARNGEDLSRAVSARERPRALGIVLAKELLTAATKHKFAPVLLNVIAGEHYATTAAKLGLPTGTVRSQVSRARADMRRMAGVA